ncbi:MAG: hypothetical protein JOZ47_06300 [Kutzneria sp.]|nr:hypothetical protein [Kutzneria sp.]MBV9844665.1 hypothetical protein [Kutzneria sp.]
MSNSSVLSKLVSPEELRKRVGDTREAVGQMTHDGVDKVHHGAARATKGAKDMTARLVGWIRGKTNKLGRPKRERGIAKVVRRWPVVAGTLAVLLVAWRAVGGRRSR